MPSTVIRRFEYRPDSRELLVEFVTGRCYIYADVPEDQAAKMRGAFAKGVYFNRHIRGRYAARELAKPWSDDKEPH
ncbi:MAG TPA: KTSC domain-containing protein [Sphingomicrobium sp.]|nr:KTSC domain-containing protein [Sphingomicrobium sp.]